MKAANLLISICVISLLGGPATAAQMDAADDPRVVGPFSGSEEPACSAEAVKTEDGETVARVKLCARLFPLDTVAESNEDRDFGILWIQSNVNSMNDWCTTATSTSGLVRSAGTVHDYVPARRYGASRGHDVKMKLIADAQGMASEKAVVSQRLTLYPIKTRPLVDQEDNGTRVTARWTGSSSKKLASVLGVEVSWDSSSGSPAMVPGLTYDFARSDC